MKDGTIQVLEVTDDPHRHHPFRHYNRISAEIEMKIKGIEGAVCLSYVKNRHTNKEIFTIKIYHTDDDDDGYYVRLDIKNQKGRDTADEYVSKQILKQLHEALGIPECQKREMIYLLFYPYMSNEHMTILTT
uniref:Uncharacterized protein n=1 Tax=Amphimedon queenslandica TaxID=400682 RepID=A0A1X7TDP3_AMPQE